VLNVYAFAVSGRRLYAGTVYGVFFTEDEGRNWKQANAGLLDVYVTGLAVSGNTLFASTVRGGFFTSAIP
ncbi:MAG TPA: regulator, partial [Blastocatellia bacterium]|nr:regulator [Blastocatellia bacterium]